MTRITDPEAGSDRTIRVALGRRVEVIGDLLLPPEPTDSSRAACRDIGRRLEDWQGPGIVILCGRLVAPGCQSGVGPAAVLGVHPELMDASAHVARRGPTPRSSSSWRPPKAIRSWCETSNAAGFRCTTPSTWRARRGPGRARCSSARRDHGTRCQPADGRHPVRRAAVAGRHGAPRRPAPGAALRDLTVALPPVAALPVGAATRAGCGGAAVARGLRDRRPRPCLPFAAPAERAAAGVRRDMVLPLHRHGGHRGAAARAAGPRRGHHVTGYLACARRRRPSGSLGGRGLGGAPDRARPTADRR